MGYAKCPDSVLSTLFCLLLSPLLMPLLIPLFGLAPSAPLGFSAFSTIPAGRLVLVMLLWVGFAGGAPPTASRDIDIAAPGAPGPEPMPVPVPRAGAEKRLLLLGLLLLLPSLASGLRPPAYLSPDLSIDMLVRGLKLPLARPRSPLVLKSPVLLEALSGDTLTFAPTGGKPAAPNPNPSPGPLQKPTEPLEA
jgi:hypothetical protein